MRFLTTPLTFLVLSSAPSSAADLRVYSGGAPQHTLKLLAPAFEQATGHRLDYTFAIVGEIRQRLEAGEKADVVLLPVPVMDALEKSGRLRPASRTLLARVGIAVVVREGAVKPDISTPDALRTTLMRARAITHSDPATPSGRHIAAMLAQMGVTDTPERKIVPRSAIGGGTEFIAKGEVEIGLYLFSEVLTTKGTAVAGMLPEALQNHVVYAGAILSDSASPDAAAEFIKFVGDPSKQEQWKATGFEAIGKAN